MKNVIKLKLCVSDLPILILHIGPCFYIYSYIPWFALMQIVKFLVNRCMMIDEIIKYLVSIAYLQFRIQIFKLR